MESLALHYRPQTFTDLVGQRDIQVMLRQMVITGRVPTALLFAGCRGTGKTTTARIVAAALNCVNENKPCGICYSCKAVFAGTHLDVTEIDAASNGLVDDIRSLRQRVLYGHTGNQRVVILDEAQSMSGAAFNALLKTLEEPPPNTTFLLLTTEPAKIPATITSRCTPFSFRRLTVADIAGRLQHIAEQQNFRTDPDLITLLAERADGAMRDAIMMLEQVGVVGLTTVEQYQRLIGHVDHSPALVNAMAAGDIAGAYTVLDAALTRVADPNTITIDLVSLLRDVLVLRSGGELTKTGQALAARQNLALALESPTIVSVMKVLWTLKTTMRLDDVRSSLELAIVLMSEIFNPARLSPNEMATYR